MKVSELVGEELEYWVAMAVDWNHWLVDQDVYRDFGGYFPYISHGGALVEWHPSEDWDIGGPLIEEYVDSFIWGDGVYHVDVKAGEWMEDPEGGDPLPRRVVGVGEELLTAACRAIVASVYGDQVPEE